MSDFDLSGRVQIDTSEVDNLGSRISRSFGGIAGVIAGAFAVDKVVDWGKAGLSAAGDYEQVGVAFTGLLGSADKAQAKLKELRDFAARTPFELPQLTEASQKLLGVGFSAESLVPTLTKIGNTASQLGVGGENINNVVRALGQMKGKGKTSAEEINQLAEALPGFNAYAAIAAYKGTSVANVMKLMQSGALSAQDGIDGILQGMEKFPGAAGAMDRQSQTLNGVISTLHDTVRNIAIDFITPAIPTIARAVNAYSEHLQHGADAVKEFINATIEGFNGSAKLDQLSGWNRMFGELGSAAATVGGMLARGFWDVAAAVHAFFDAFQGKRDIKEATDSWDAFGRSTGRWTNEIAPKMLSTLDHMRDVLPKLAPLVAGAGAAFATWQIASTIATASTAIGTLIGWISAAVTAAGGLGAAILAVAGPVGIAVAAIGALVAGVIYAYQNFQRFRDFVGAMATYIEEQFGHLVAFGVQMWPQLSEAVTHAMNVIGDVVNTVLAVTRFVWSQFGDDIIRIVGGVFDVLQGIVSFAVNTIANVIRFVLAVINGDWSKAGDALVGIMRGVWDLMSAVVRGGLTVLAGIIGAGYQVLKSAASGVFAAITDSIGDVVNAMFKAGQNVIEGFVGGIRSVAHKVIDTIRSFIVDPLPSFVQKALDMHSPSRVFERLGRQIPLGLAQGIVNGSGSVTDALASMVAVPNMSGLGAVTSGDGYGSATLASSGSSVTVGDIHLYGVADGDSVRGVLPELIDAIRAGVGNR